ncbi:Uncharacterised protein [Bordetella pertussis]|uniref:Uncharacterized protein n=2 Tax=Bordetella pertussis TaxID=520 RepID=A0A381A0H6_BORPT|nr:hypothetical protein [Bordetella pertussis]ETH39912.1 hypothetical protein L547_1946 [Bordetella pertussis H918]ETH42500.1 hypothetical protein L549_2733 [Bordetella pertussis H939]ETH48143.1 hypothetical protein L548_2896 [Bordetella pertussis H921]ETH69740.1 hypothetical protein L545_2063 [Bordetella pertussis STO1-CHLA-0011]ETH91624.1 hypothetical protein L561_2589 [Bordetella pertussis STO1-CHOC-0019]ETH99225.1 hypothetical protein L556_2043 [Bordetella pertussis STO1-CHOM-0012]KCV207
MIRFGLPCPPAAAFAGGLPRARTTLAGLQAPPPVVSPPAGQLCGAPPSPRHAQG